jgi:hypothetical protein
MQYKLICRPYSLSLLIGQATRGRGGTYADKEAADFNNALNKEAKDGWKVKTSGAIKSGRNVIFWGFVGKTVRPVLLWPTKT